MTGAETRGVILIKNGRVYGHDGDVDLPPVANVSIVNRYVGKYG